jgi:hypothetical protein
MQPENSVKMGEAREANYPSFCVGIAAGEHALRRLENCHQNRQQQCDRIFQRGPDTHRLLAGIYRDGFQSPAANHLAERSAAVRNYSVASRVPERFAPASVITIERSTTDTGERKQFFGRTARRLVTLMTRSDGPETTIDGWYIDVPGLPKLKSGAGGYFTVLTGSAGGQKLGPPKIEVKQTGPLPEGLPVWRKMTSSVVLPGGSRQDSEHVTEVSDLMEGTLPDKLFQPPDGYRRVASLPDAAFHPGPHTWAELLQAHWRMMEDWFSTLF